MSEESKLKTEQSFLQILELEFQKRCKRNDAYSMRAFAKFLEVDQSLLSKIMRGQRPVSKMNLQKMGEKLGLSASKIKSLIRNMSFTPDAKFSVLPDDEFSMISDWLHFAILELSKTNSFKPDAQTIARRLGVQTEQVIEAVDRLRRLGFVQDQDDSWSIRPTTHSWTNNDATTMGRKLLQRDLIEKSLKAIDTVPFDLRDNGSLTVAIDKSRLPEFKEELRQFRQRLGSFFQDSDQLDEVYQVTIALFPLTTQD